MGLRHHSMGAVNQYLVLEYVRDHPGTTRSRIAQDLSLSQASVSRMVSELLKSNILIETSATQAGDGIGRPSVGLTINLDVESVIGIDLGGTKCHGALAHVDGTILSEHVVTVDEAGSAFDALKAVWDHLAATAAERDLNVASLAIGIPAVVDPKTGLAWRGPNVGWEGFDLVGRVREFGVPFIADNDVNLAALAEGSVGKAQGFRDYALISIGTGLGGAIVTEGRLLRGRNNAGGEISTMLGSVSQVRREHTAGAGGLETMLSGVAIASRAQQLIADDQSLVAELGETPSAKDVIDSAVAGGKGGGLILEEVIDSLALAIINVCAVTDPEAVIIDGSIGRALEPFFDDIAELVAMHMITPPQILKSELGPNSTVAGAIAGALQHLRQQAAPQVLNSLTFEGVRS